MLRKKTHVKRLLKKKTYGLWSTLTGCEFITSSNAVEKKQY